MDHFNEMFNELSEPRDPYTGYNKWLSQENMSDLQKKNREAEAVFRRTGITFNVYGDNDADERLIPFDIIPRILGSTEWRKLSNGLQQRVRAINAFIYDVYHQQEIFKAGWLPQSLIQSNPAFVPQMIGFTPPGGVYTHIVGVDLVRTKENEFYVLEDNVRTPSGVSYMLENRETMLELFPELFSITKVKSVTEYPTKLLKALSQSAPEGCDSDPVIGVLTPGIHNSAYFEHAFLADQMGVELIEGHDVRVVDGKLAMRTTKGYQGIDILYRRIDDDFLDPLTFNSTSLLGIPGLMDVYKAGALTLANAPGTGVADDKAIYSFMPEIIRFYMGEEPLLKNVKTWRCSEKDQLQFVLENLKSLVVKEVHGSGGYGMLVGPGASKIEVEKFRQKLLKTPHNYIAQPMLSLSTVPILKQASLASRHVDLRPFVLVSPKEVYITPGGLTRVALKSGSVVVNSSQGGGTKDTWVLEDN